MNIIKTAGDLIKALSVYDENAIVEFSLNNQTMPNSLNNDTAIFQMRDVEGGKNILHIALIYP